MRLAYIPPKRKQLLLSQEQRKPVRTAVRGYDTAVIEDVIAPLENCYNLSESLLESVISQEITLKHGKKAENQSPVQGIYLTAAGMLFLLGAGLTFLNAPVNVQSAFYLLSLAVMVGFDPLDLFSQVLAKESRKLICFVMAMSAVGLYLFMKIVRFWLVTGVMALIVAVLVKLLNYRWMRSENYLMDEVVEGAIVNNPDSLAYQAYIFSGKTKCRTLALRQNLQFNEKVLDGCLGLFYRLGWADGHKKVEQVHVTIQKLTERAEKAEREARTAQETAETALANYKIVAAERDSLRDRVQTAEASKDYAMKLYESIKDENLRLTAANEELVAMAASEEPIINISKVIAAKQEIKESGEDRARELLRQGYSIRKTVDLSGVSFYNVNRIRTEMVENGELQQTDRKVVNM